MVCNYAYQTIAEKILKKYKGIFEHRDEPVISSQQFRLRIFSYLAIASSIIVISLLIGMIGYHALEAMNWLDAFLNAAMILGGMGPVNELHTASGKFFAGCYALYSGLVFLVTAGLIFGPLLHRLLHKFHVDEIE